MHYLGPLQSHRDAVEEDECKDDVVEELVGDNGLAEQPEPDKRGREEGRGERETRGEVYSRNGNVSKVFQFSFKKAAPSRYPTMLTGQRRYCEYT